MSKYLNRKEAAAHLKQQGYPVAAGTLAKLAVIGGGPPYACFGRRPMYTTADLDAWAESRLSAPRRNTSDIENDAPVRRRGRPRKVGSATAAPDVVALEEYT